MTEREQMGQFANELDALIERFRQEYEVTWRSSEQYFADRDLFLRYVEDSVNPARAAEGLEVASRAVASHLFDVIAERRYRK